MNILGIYWDWNAVADPIDFYGQFTEIVVVDSYDTVMEILTARNADGLFEATVSIDDYYLPGTYTVSAYDGLGFLASRTTFEVLDSFSSITEPHTNDGDIVVMYYDDHAYRPWLTSNEDSIVNAAHIGEYLIFADDLIVNFRECGEANAFYAPSTNQITMCYELAELYRDYLENVAQDEDLATAIRYSLYWVFLHELGHAIIDIYDLPITGQEENVADQFANTMLLRDGDSGVEALYYMAYIYKQKSEFDNTHYWTTHSLNPQRFYNILCMMYGSDTTQFKHLVDDGILPEQRAKYCTEEYKRANDSWTRLLADHTRY